MPSDDDQDPCQACGACCSHSRAWPRFTTEAERDLERIPRHLVEPGGGGLRCDGDRCAALVGDVGRWTACSIYEDRPLVCRACEPGDEACTIARLAAGMPALAG